MFIKFIRYMSYLFIAYILLGFLLLPFILKPQLIKIINNQTDAKVEIQSLSFNPLIFQLTLDNLSLRDLQKNDLLSFDTLRINVNPTSLLYGALELKELSLLRPRISLVYSKDKTINFSHILKNKREDSSEDKESNTTTALPHIIIDTIKVEGGELLYTDYSKKSPFHFSLQNIGFGLTDFDTQKIEQKHSSIHLYSSLGDGGLIDFKSKVNSLKPLKVEGTLTFEASKLYTEWKYLKDELNLEVADGKISFFTRYAFNLDDIKNTKIEGLNLRVEKLRIKPKNKTKDILNLDRLDLQNAVIFPLKQEGTIEKIALNGLRIKVKRDAKSEIDWLGYLKTKSSADHNKTTSKSAKKPQATQAWRLSLATLDLQKIAVVFDDEAIKPKVRTTVDELDLYAEDLTLAGIKPFNYKIKVLLNQKTDCYIDGSLAHKEFDLVSLMKCRDFDIVHYRPYIDTAAQKSLLKYDLSLDKATLGFEAKARIKDKNSTFITEVNDANVSLKGFALSKKSTHTQIVNFQEFAIDGILFNSAKQELNVSSVKMDTLIANLMRKKNGKLNIDQIIVPKRSKQVKKESKKRESDYRVRINHIALNNSKVVFTDKVLKQEQKEIVDKINITINKLDSKEKSWLNYNASLRLNKKGIIQADGKVRHTPLKQSGTIRAKDISLQPISPYLQEKSYLRIDDGRFSFLVNESYLPSKKYPDLRMHGAVALDSLFITNTNDANSSLFSLNELRVKPFTLELSPNRLYVDEVTLDSFYLSAKIDENKTINFAKLMKDNNSSKSVEKKKESKSKHKSNNFPVKIVKVNVSNGSAEFQDFSLPIKFRTNIHDLNGKIYAISSTPGETTYLDIGGEVDKYGSTKLKGSLDSFNLKEYTDMNLNFKNLDLHAMSGYSASFAGYKIDSGKLYLDLGYKILHSQLDATNNIMIKKIKLGEELEGKNIHHLPLGFVIGLLEDSDGIVDIDMPIKGDVDAPDFKYGALVWKTLGNLIAKAVTSPFKFLGSMLGLNGDELEYIAFEVGKSGITPPQREKLDKIVKMMLKRPKINLKINGSYDDVADLEALKRQKLVATVLKKSGDENVKNSKTALNITMLEELYGELRSDDRVQKLKNRLQKEYTDSDAFKRAYQNSLIKICTDIQNVTKKELENLGKKRAKMIVSYLVDEKGVLAKRVIEGAVVSSKENNKKVIKVKLDIEVQSKDK